MNRQLVFLLPRIDKNVFSAHALLARQDFYASFLAKEQGGNYKKALAHMVRINQSKPLFLLY
jgi:hypothetical protein